ncbi:hypothetical protein Pst134EA_013111 [Puccinia striiformis f. sp. tritici]|uniref:EF-hand domain-containing protein n=1 Tax=Puccinia striiformis f. sp. tritici PST-78 TaxID=1165861 RepID=A0A0L0USY7_9BASI|nr:hypothetical protein Pst134EA_013111 [Puccinia striiformis f. sp. tritici]KAH9454007.1 hypothetical protein Pst134EB_014104 [Puccinia striiformis f. sp. tritici]KAH9465218.1 hypothetical protein Pst134EA_013111 [Puccinia striiformis f. sp. tritici]KNE90168.1 hypothetical protein PSTG_16391 [Puccinia striiformis f. sp. tritici PST-78]
MLSPTNVGRTLRTEEETHTGMERDVARSHPNEMSADSLIVRYQRAVKGESQSTLTLAETNEDDQPAETMENGPSTPSSESDFDWDDTDESELDESERQEREQQKLREVQGQQEHEHIIRHAKRLRRFCLFFMSLSGPVRTTIVSLLGSGIAITPALLVWFRFTDVAAKNHILAWSVWLSASFAATCATSIIVNVLPSIVIKLFTLLYGSTPESLKTQVELWTNVRFWTKVAACFGCYWVTLSVMFSGVFHLRDDPHLHYFKWVKKVVVGLFTAGAVLLAEKILLKVIQLNFHRTSLKDRLEENGRALRALDRLAAAKGLSHSPKKRNSTFSFAQYRLRSAMRTPQSHAKHSTVVDVPPTPLTPSKSGPREKRPAGNSAAGETSSVTADQKLESTPQKQGKSRRSSSIFMMAKNLASKNEDSAASGVLSSTHSAKKLAKKLFAGLDQDRGGVITQNEIEPYFKTVSEAAKAFKLFDKDGNGDIDRKEMRNAVVRIYRERRELASSLKNMSSAVSKLDAVLITIASVLTIFFGIFILDPQGASARLMPMATIILGFSFIFGNAAKNLFESMLFIFSIHPYDVGDMVSIDDKEMVVMEFGLFSTTFVHLDGKMVVAPNSQLIGKKHIVNIRRSGPMSDKTSVMVGFDTPLEVLHEFRARLRQYVAKHDREWTGVANVNIDYMSNQNLIQLKVLMQHKSNFQDMNARWARRTLFMKEMKRVMDSLGMSYKLPIQPISLLVRRPDSKLLISSSAGLPSPASTRRVAVPINNSPRALNKGHDLPAL